MPGPYAAGGLGRLRVRHATAGATPGANTSRAGPRTRISFRGSATPSATRSSDSPTRSPGGLHMSSLFLRTLREDPADAEVPSHRLLVRAGYVRRVSPGVYTWLPLG